MIKRWYTLTLSVMLAAGVMSGCSGGSGGDGADAGKASLKTLVQPLGENEQTSVKIYTEYMNESNFILNYGNSYLVKFPNVDVTFLTRPRPSGQPDPTKDPFEDVYKLIEEEKPDIVMLSPQTLEKFAQKGMLYNLDPLIKQDQFDLQNLHPGVVEALRTQGQGKLYGLSPFFSSQALFYNKDLFDKHQVPYPKDQMSWEELHQLARRFPTTGSGDDSTYGLLAWFNKPSFGFFGMQFAYMHGLSEVDPSGKKMTVANDDYKKTLNLLLLMSRSDAIYMPDDANRNIEFTTPSFRTFVDPFVAGKTAMGIESSSTPRLLAMLKDGNLQPFNWQLVTVPVDPKRPDVSNFFNIFSIFAVNAKSSNVRAAWQLVKYWNSAEYADYSTKAFSNSSSGSWRLTTRVSFNKPVEGRSLEPFYKLKPGGTGPFGNLTNLPQAFLQSLDKIYKEEATDILDGRKSIDDGLAAIQERGQKELDSLNSGAGASKSP